MADVTPGQAESPQAFGTDAEDIARRWTAELEFALKQRDKFFVSAGRLEKRFMNEQLRQTKDSKYAIFWSNVETMKPAIYAKSPKLAISRRHDDDDPIARVASRILERAGNFDLETFSDFHDSLDPATLDYLVVGQGTVWNRFEAITGDESIQITANQAPSITEVLKTARAPVDLVSWEHFLVSPSRTWDETRWVARCVPFTLDEGSKRFDKTLEPHGKTFKDVPRQDFGTQNPKRKNGTADDGGEKEFFQRAMVWEIWDKPSGQVYWIVLGFPFPLDSRVDPLRLTNFFPCPKPLLATVTSRSIIPKADYHFYQDQARELNDVTQRLATLTEALQVIGLYDDSQPELADMLNPSSRNKMVPIKSWAAFADKGGLKGVIDFWPLDRVIETMTQLEARRQTLIQMIYEITGISDIIRGATNPNETLGAQQIKGKFAGLRLEQRKSKVALFASQAAAIKMEITARHFPAEMIAKLAQVDQMGEDPAQVQQALQLIKAEPDFMFRVEVQVDTMVQLDLANEQQEKTEFLTMVSNFIREATAASQTNPLLGPLFMEMLKFGVRGFRVGRSLEGKIDQTTKTLLQKLAQTQANPPPPKPTPEEVKLQIAQMEDKREREKLVVEQQNQQPEVAPDNSEQEKAVMQADFKRMQAELSARETEMRAALIEQTAKEKAVVDDLLMKLRELEFSFTEAVAKIENKAAAAEVVKAKQEVATEPAAEAADAAEDSGESSAALAQVMTSAIEQANALTKQTLDTLAAVRGPRKVEITTPSGAVYKGNVS